MVPLAPAVIRIEGPRRWQNRDPVFPFVSGSSALPALIAAGDPRSTRLVYALVIGLVVIGIALVVLGVWLVRQTRYDPELLAPLERMGDHEWQSCDPVAQRRLLDEVRPEGAVPLQAMPSPPPLIVDFEDIVHDEPLSDLGADLDSTDDNSAASSSLDDPTPPAIEVDFDVPEPDDQTSPP